MLYFFRSFFLIFALCLGFNLTIEAQSVIIIDTLREDSGLIYNQRFIDLATCEDTLYGGTAASFIFMQDISYHSGGSVFTYGMTDSPTGGEGLYQYFPSWLANVGWNFEDFEINQSVKAMTCDQEGNIYLAGTGLSVFRPPYNQLQEVEYIGALPPAFQAGGDMTFRNGELFLTTLDNKVVKVDIENPEQSELVWTLPQDIDFINGMVSIPISCDSIDSYGFATGENGSTIYKMDFDNQLLEEICQTEVTVVGAAAEEECLLPDCTFYVDLDFDDSSGVIENDFQSDSICVPPINVTDEDVVITSPIGVDSIVIEIQDVLNNGFEYLELTNNGLIVEGNGTERIVVKKSNNSILNDFETVLKTTLYHNDATEIIYGDRQVIFTLYSYLYTSIPSISTIHLDNSSLKIIEEIQDVSCKNAMDGAVVVEGIGGEEPYSFEWGNGIITNERNNLDGGIYHVTITESEGCTRPDSILISEPDSLIVIIQTEQDSFCGPVGSLEAAVTGGIEPYEASWSNGEQNTFNLSNLLPGDYSISIEDNNGCMNSEEITLFHSDSILVSEVIDACEGDNINISGEIFTQDTSFCNYYIGINGCDSIHCYSISFLDTSLVTDYFEICNGEQIEINNVVFTQDTSLCYTFTGQNGCDSTYCFELDVIELVHYSELEICEGEDFYFNGELITESGDYSYFKSNDIGCDSLISIYITVNPIPNEEIDIFGNLCEDSDIQLSIGNQFLSYLWSDESESNSIIANSPGTYFVTITDENGCSNVSSLEVLDANLSFDISIINPVCLNENDGIVVVESIIGGTPPFLYSIDNNNFQTSNIFENLAPGEITLTVEDFNGCQAEQIVFIDSPDVLVNDLPNDIYLDIGDKTEVEFYPNSGVTVQWEPIDFLSCDSCSKAEINPLTTITYNINFIDSLGCFFQHSFTVFVNTKENIYIPNAFSPNDDGFNDLFTIYGGQAIEKIKSFQIFDRWGALVFEENDQSINSINGWDGTFNGRNAIQGVYIYRIVTQRIDGQEVVNKGEIALIR